MPLCLCYINVKTRVIMVSPGVVVRSKIIQSVCLLLCTTYGPCSIDIIIYLY